eukprot:285792-Pleurochrysis_carterae.AAC.3
MLANLPWDWRAAIPGKNNGVRSMNECRAKPHLRLAYDSSQWTRRALCTDARWMTWCAMSLVFTRHI